ncbi:hypothetical protein PENSPDRAFT_694577 [Peniophora sp. CONT]|nr:hypothetical protein PENSPDRAFT_694577 [Peniophora sp. CONT]
MARDRPSPIVDEVLACRHDWVDALKSVWQAAQADRTAFPMLKARIEDDFDPGNGTHDTTVEANLSSHVLRLQPPDRRDEFDLYTIELLSDIWQSAYQSPTVLDELLSGEFDHEDLSQVHRRLAWSMWKLQTNGLFRARSRDNSPVRQLPVELLRVIFEELRAAHPRYPLLKGQDVWDRSSHLYARQICTQWRTIIDQTPSLWSPIVVDYNPYIARLALNLSKPEALDIITPRRPPRPRRLGPSNEKLIAYLLPQQLFRIRTLDIATRSWDETERVLDLLTASSAPCLESFRLSPGVHNVRNDYPAVTITPSIFSSDPPPSLRAVTVADLTIPLPSPLVQPTLVRLDLTRCRIWSSLDAMVDTLASLQALEEFCWRMSRGGLEDVGIEIMWPFESFMESSRNPVELRALHKLTLECPIQCTTAIFSHIVMPRTCRVAVLDDYMLTGEIEVERLETLVLGLRGTVGNHLLGAHVAEPCGTCPHVSLSQHPLAFSSSRNCLRIEGFQHDNSDDPDTAVFSISVFVNDRDATREEMQALSVLVREVLGWAGVKTATRLYADDPVVARFELWPAVLRSLPSLRCIDLGRSTRTKYASANVASLTQALALEDPLAPLLSRIVLRDLNLPLLLQKRLAFVIRSRFPLGCSMVALRIVNCDVDIDRLMDILRWDGAGMIYYEDDYSYQAMHPSPARVAHIGH